MRYQTNLEDVGTEHLAGFFLGWLQVPSRETHLALLHGSTHVVLAREGAQEPLVGFVTAISDGVLSAYIPLLEVRPEYRHQGVGTELVTRLVALLGDMYMIDVLCDEHVRPFYERLGFTGATGAAIRRHELLNLYT